MIDESELPALLETDGSEVALRCVEAIQQGATIAPLEESTELDQHIRWFDKHRLSLTDWNPESSLTRMTEFLEDPSTQSVVLTSIGLRDETILPQEFYTVAIDPVRRRVVICLAVPRTPPRRG